MSETDLQTNSQILGISRWVDASYDPETEPETVLWRRIAKGGEEHGEVIQALIGAIGENPRKGVTHSFGDVERELFDVALCALAAVYHLRDQNYVIRGPVMASFRDHVAVVAERAGIAVHNPEG